MWRVVWTAPLFLGCTFTTPLIGYSEPEGRAPSEESSAKAEAPASQETPVAHAPEGTTPQSCAEIQTEKSTVAANTNDRGWFLQYVRGQLSVGDPGVIVDLGGESDVAARLGGSSSCSAFSRLALVDGSFNDTAANALFSSANAQVLPVEGRLYVFRTARRNGPDLVAKAVVTAVEETRSVTIEWTRLSP
jgi:hypothetical protein